MKFKRDQDSDDSDQKEGEYESGWLVKFFIDACYSGTAKDATEEWLLNQKDYVV